MCAKFRFSISSRCDDIVAEVKGRNYRRAFSPNVLFFNHVLWVHKMLNVREIQVCQSKFMDILIAELLFDVSVGPEHWSGQNIPVP